MNRKQRRARLREIPRDDRMTLMRPGNNTVRAKQLRNTYLGIMRAEKELEGKLNPE